MQVAYCPQCGEEICGDGNKFRFSYSGLFSDPNEIIKYEIAKSIDFSSIKKKSSSKESGKKGVGLSEENEYEYESKDLSVLENNGLSVTAGALKGDYSEAEEIISSADRSMLGADFDLNENKYKQKYVFAYELYNIISQALENDNRVIDFWLSTECESNIKNSLKDKFQSLPIVENIMNASDYDELSGRVKMFFTPEESKKYGEDYNKFLKIREILTLFTKKTWDIKFDYDRLEEIFENGSIIGLKYGNSNYVKRICPKCGAHISVYLGIYKQKIVSFIGTPTSGKSTIINAIYYKIRQSRHKINGIIGELNLCDPYYKEYESNAAKMEKKLAVDKTAKGTFPILYALLSKDSQSGEKAVYTFVDVPGEYFDVNIDGIRGNQAALSRINIIKKHSDILCIVIAFEQLLGRSPDKEATEATMAEIKDDTLTNFENACKVFFDGKVNCETVLLISKSDAMKGKNLEGSTDGWLTVEDALNHSRKTYVRYKSYDDLKNLKNQNDDYFYNKHTIISEKLDEYTKVSRELMNINKNRWEGSITRIIGCVKDIDDVKVFFVSSYGFYAINSIDSLTDEEKKQALKNQRDLKDDEAANALEIYKREASNDMDASSQQMSEAKTSSTSEENASKAKENLPKSKEVQAVSDTNIDDANKVSNSGVNLQKNEKKTSGGRGRKNKAPSREETQTTVAGQTYMENSNHTETKDVSTSEKNDKAESSPKESKNITQSPSAQKIAPQDLLKQKDEELKKIKPTLSCNSVKESFFEYYAEKHNNHNPEGVNVLVYFFLSRTRYILSDSDEGTVRKLRKKIEQYNENIREEKKRLEGFVGFWISIWTKILNKVCSLFNKEYKNEHERFIEEYESTIKDLEDELKKYEF